MHRPLFKKANDDSLEQSFFTLAYDKLQDQLKNILPSLVGFEIVRKNENNTKALGVFGFRSNSGQILYVPAFFVNGKVKNLDLLYSKNNEQFYPLNEEFAELFLKDEQLNIGNQSTEDRSSINRDAFYGDFQQMAVPPRTGKTALGSVIDYVKDADDKTKDTFLNLIEKDANFCEAVLRFYPIEKIAEAVVKLDDGDKYRSKSLVSVVYPTDKEAVKGLPKEKKQDLLTQGFVVVDERPSEAKSKFGVIEYLEKFTNPSESGFHSYITEYGGLRYGLMLVRPKQLLQHFSTDDTIVIDLDADKKGTAYIVDTKKVFIKDQIKVRDYSEVHKMMVDAAQVKPGYSSTYVLINENLQATQVFRVNANFKDASGIRRIVVEPFHVYDECDRELSGPKDRPGSAHKLPRGNFYEHPKDNNETVLVMTKKPGDELEYNGKFIYVPSGYKLLEVDVCRDGSAYESCCDTSFGSSEVSDERKKVLADRERRIKGKPGTPHAVHATLAEKNVFPMTVNSNGSEYFINLKGAKKKYDNPMEAKIAMTLKLGMDFNEASALIDSIQPGVTKKGHIKLAYLGDQYPQPYEESPYSNEFGQPTYQGLGMENMLPNDNPYTGNPTQQDLGTMPDIEGVDPNYVNQAVQLAQGGQKEIFDTHMISTLAKYVSVSDKVSEYLPAMVEAMDKLGRILFLLHWETDKFEEMYGKGDLPELVELVTNVFKNQGDLILFLKKKSPELSINMTRDEQLDV